MQQTELKFIPQLRCWSDMFMFNGANDFQFLILSWIPAQKVETWIFILSQDGSSLKFYQFDQKMRSVFNNH